MRTKELVLLLTATALTVAVLFFAAIWGIESYFGEPSIHRDDAASEAKRSEVNAQVSMAREL